MPEHPIVDDSSFEDEVASLYTSMGYEVIRDPMIAGKQVDLEATINLTGIGPTTILIECKRGGNSGLRASDVERIAGNLQQLAQLRGAHAVALITDYRFSSAAIQIARKTGLRCFTLSELQDEALGIREYLERFLNHSVHQTSHSYIDLFLGEAGPDLQTLREPASEYFNRWLDDTTTVLVVLGEAGSGKTALCQKLAADTAKAYSSAGRKRRIPVILPLRGWRSSATSYEFIGSFLRLGRESSDSWNLISHLNDTGKLLLIFDGLEELNPADFPQFSSELDRLSSVPGTKIVLTSRPSVFHSMSASLFGAIKRSVRMATVEPLDKTQIDAFINENFTTSTKAFNQQYYGKLEHLYPLLIHPLFLRSFIHIIHSKAALPSIAHLYESYATQQLEANQGPTGGANASIVFEVLGKIASHLTESAQHTFRFLEVSLIVDQLNPNQLDRLPFLTKTSGDDYCFTHKSFQEFFLARMLAIDVSKGNPVNLSKFLLREEVLTFLSDLNPPVTPLRQWLNASLRNPEVSEIFVENINLLIRQLTKHDAKKVTGLSVAELWLHDIKCFEEARFEFAKDSTTRTTLLIGENAVGKSTVLQTIALCAVGPDLASRLVFKPDTFLRRGSSFGFMRAKFLITSEGKTEQVVICLKIVRGDRRFTLVTEGKYRSQNHERYLNARSSIHYSGLFIAAYGPWRHFDLTDDSIPSLGEDLLLDRVCSLFDPKKLLFNAQSLSRLIVGDGRAFQELGAPPAISGRVRATLVQLLGALLPESDEHHFTDGGMYEGRFGQTGLAELSDGYRSTFAWVGHVLVHLFSTVGWAENIEDVNGVVIIDELDLHLHPKWQRVILDKIRKAFPNLQLISSTHSPLILADVDTTNGEAILLRHENGKVRVETHLPQTRGMRVDQILAGELFDYIIDRDPTTERIFREASILAGKGFTRSKDEELRYKFVCGQLQDALASEGQTLVQRDVALALDEALSARARYLEKKLFEAEK